MSRALLSAAGLTRRQIILFALASAVINGAVTATVGGWLAHAYAKHQSRRESIEAIVHLVYERRTRAGMIASAIRRGADTDEIRQRKSAYDEAYVDWNKNVMLNLFAIREAAGDLKFSALEPVFEDQLIAAMADVDRCITKAYDTRVANGDAKAVLDQCRLAEVHQFVLDCGATFTNELYKLTQLTFLPFSGEFDALKADSERLIKKNCTRPELPPLPAPVPAPAVVAVPPPAAPAAEAVPNPPAGDAAAAAAPAPAPAAQ